MYLLIATHGEQRTRPFLVTPFSSAPEDHLWQLIRSKSWPYEMSIMWLTVVPSLSFSRFKVTPEGTTREESTIVAQEVFDWDARDQPSEPLNVQAVALLATASFKLGGGVG